MAIAFSCSMLIYVHCKQISRVHFKKLEQCIGASSSVLFLLPAAKKLTLHFHRAIYAMAGAHSKFVPFKGEESPYLIPFPDNTLSSYRAFHYSLKPEPGMHCLLKTA